MAARKPRNGSSDVPESAAPQAQPEETASPVQGDASADAGAASPAAPAEATETPAPQVEPIPVNLPFERVPTSAEDLGLSGPTGIVPPPDTGPLPAQAPSSTQGGFAPSLTADPALQDLQAKANADAAAELDKVGDDTAPMTEAFEAARQVPSLSEESVDETLHGFRVVRTLLECYDPAGPSMQIEHIPTWVRRIIGHVLAELDGRPSRITRLELVESYKRHYARTSDYGHGGT